MTRVEENIGKAVCAVLILGIGWIGNMVSANNQLTMANQVALSENKVLTLEIQKDITAMRIDMRDSKERIGTLETKVAQNQSAISYLGKEQGL